MLSIHLCGRQKPLVTWSIDNETVTTQYSNTTENTTADAQYVYSVVLPEVSASMCGRTLKYIATGYESDKIGTALLDIQCMCIIFFVNIMRIPDGTFLITIHNTGTFGCRILMFWGSKKISPI